MSRFCCLVLSFSKFGGVIVNIAGTKESDLSLSGELEWWKEKGDFVKFKVSEAVCCAKSCGKDCNKDWRGYFTLCLVALQWDAVNALHCTKIDGAMKYNGGLSNCYVGF